MCLYGRLAFHNQGRIDWSSNLERMFHCIMASLNLPVTYGESGIKVGTKVTFSSMDSFYFWVFQRFLLFFDLDDRCLASEVRGTTLPVPDGSPLPCAADNLDSLFLFRPIWTSCYWPLRAIFTRPTFTVPRRDFIPWSCTSASFLFSGFIKKGWFSLGFLPCYSLPETCCYWFRDFNFVSLRLNSTFQAQQEVWVQDPRGEEIDGWGHHAFCCHHEAHCISRPLQFARRGKESNH